MTPRLLRFSFPFILLVSGGLYASTFFNPFRPFSALYPPPGPYQLLREQHAGTRYVEASAGAHYVKNFASAFLLGKHYRFLWTTPVKIKVLNLKKENLTILRKGGGMQTTSFTLIHKNGREYYLRSIDKNPVAVLPAFWHYTIVAAFTRDQISATDPFGLPVVAQLAHAAGVYQEDPQMVYLLPDDPAFGNYPGVRGSYMLYPKFGRSPQPLDLNKKFIGHYSTTVMLRRRKESSITVDSLAYLNCRLFDLLIGDWDRHAGQWDWHAFSGQKGTVLKPVPKDRDQAFGYYEDGVLPWILTRNFAVRKISSFGPEFEDMQGFLENGLLLDKQLLRNIPEAKFLKIARGLQLKITDQVIEAAVKKYPVEVYAQIAPRIQTNLKSRRNNLPEAAKAFYRILHQP
jgi:hypothetical protein